MHGVPETERAPCPNAATTRAACPPGRVTRRTRRFAREDGGLCAGGRRTTDVDEQRWGPDFHSPRSGAGAHSSCSLSDSTLHPCCVQHVVHRLNATIWSRTPCAARQRGMQPPSATRTLSFVLGLQSPSRALAGHPARISLGLDTGNHSVSRTISTVNVHFNVRSYLSVRWLALASCFRRIDSPLRLSLQNRRRAIY